MAELMIPFDAACMNHCVTDAISYFGKSEFPDNVLDVHFVDRVLNISGMLNALRHKHEPPVVGSADPDLKAKVDAMGEKELLAEMQTAFSGPPTVGAGENQLASLSVWQLFLLKKAITMFGPAVLRQFGLDEGLVDRIIDVIDGLL